MTAKLPEPRRDYSAPEYDVDAVDRAMMARCIELARRGVEEDEHPFASVIARRGPLLLGSQRTRYAAKLISRGTRRLLPLLKLDRCSALIG